MTRGKIGDGYGGGDGIDDVREVPVGVGDGDFGDDFGDRVDDDENVGNPSSVTGCEG